MSKRVLCKFFAHGVCLKGEHCDFSHDWKDKPRNICTFYQKGLCSYGSRCRYEHVKVPHQISASSSSSHPHVALNHVQVACPSSVISSCESPVGPSIPSDLSSTSGPSHPLVKPAWTMDSETHILSENMNQESSTLSEIADQPLCSFAADGNCPYGESCPQIHGDLCVPCGKHCLHPYCPDEREQHIKLCQKNSKRQEALRYSQEIECSVCLERVLSKPAAAERKFGLLSECDHPFCISCIRNWRSNPPSSGMNINTALRACPICRKLSYFVIPSITWYSSKEEKQEIIDSYKARLRSIDCKHFDFGNGRCPFGTSCFYKHTYKPHMSWPHARGRPQTNWRHRNVGINEDEHNELDAGGWLRNVGINEEDFGDLDAEDVDYNSLMMEMTFLLMEFGFDEWESASDEEN